MRTPEQSFRCGKRVFGIFSVMILWVAAAAFPGSVKAALFEPPESLKALVAEAVSENEGIRQIEAELEALKMEVPAAAALDDPRITLGINALPVNTFNFNQEPMTQKQVFITQRLPWFGKLSLREKRAVWAAARKVEMLRAKKLELRRGVAEAYFDLIYTGRALALNAQLRKMVGQILQVAEAAYAAGKGLQQDVFQAQVELGKLMEETETLTSRKRGLEDRLNALLNRDGFLPIDIREDPGMPAEFPDGKTLGALALDHNPGLAALRADIEKAGVEVEMAKKDYWPDLDVTVGYGQRDEDPNGKDFKDFVSGAVAFNIPLWAGKKQDKKLGAAQKRKQAAERAYADLRRSLPFTVETLTAEMVSIRENHRLLDQALILQSDQWARAALSAYTVGKVNFDTLINAQMRKLRLSLAADRYRTSAYKILARLEELTGDPEP